MLDEQQQSNNSGRLNQARNLARNIPKNPVQAAKSIANAASLAKYIDPFIDWLYGIALAIAILKDILDLVGIGSLPAIGTVVTFIASLSIGFIMLITGSFFTARWARRVGVLLVGTLIEFVFGIDFLPIETLIVILVFYMTLQGRAQYAAKKEAQKKSAAQNMASEEV